MNEECTNLNTDTRNTGTVDPMFVHGLGDRGNVLIARLGDVVGLMLMTDDGVEELSVNLSLNEARAIAQDLAQLADEAVLA